VSVRRSKGSQSVDRSEEPPPASGWREPAGWALIASVFGALLYVALSIAAERFYVRFGLSAQAVGLSRESLIARSAIGGVALLAIYGVGGALAVWIGTKVARVLRERGLMLLGPLISAGIGLVPLLLLVGADFSGLVTILLILVAILGVLLLLGWIALGATRWPKVGPFDAPRQVLIVSAALFPFVGLTAAADDAADRVLRGEVPDARTLGFVTYPWSATVAFVTSDARLEAPLCLLYLGESDRAVFMYQPTREESGPGHTLRLPTGSQIELHPGLGAC
jgi:hypothetical protein